VSNLKLVPDQPTPLEKLLLEASRAELPSEDHKARLRAALGIGLPVAAPLSQPPASSTHPLQPASPASPSLPPAAGAVGKSATAAKVALGVAVAALAGAFAFSRSSEPAPAPAKPIVVTEAPAPAAAPPPAAPAPAPAEPAVSPLPPVEQQPAPAPRSAKSDGSAADDLSEQIRLIEAARAGVAAHDAKGALSALDSYSAKFPRGSFGQEATVLRIRALDQSGDSARATAMAKSFVARFPNSPHVARLKPIAERGASR
jgi:hypothetical protein